ncbi:MAG TPA: S1 RNA-binding domain-containing protein [Candidatus Sulfomarinibacteraceae bacterium]|nr:S1 RNA-binding domain-containing protein [Candidatus Sulfomarinibacteraceae bacterium]
MAKEESQVTTDVDFAQEMASLLDQHDYESPKVGDIRNAIIVSMSQQGIIVDLGLKRDGIIQPADLEKLEPEERESLAIDDEIPVYILSTDEQDSLLVSLHMARMNEDWIQAQELLDSGEVIEVEISGHNRGGALAPFGRLRGFIPASHLTFLNPGMSDQDRQRRMAKAHGEKIPVKVIEVDRRRRRLVLSHREAERVWQDRRRRELMETLQEGDVVTGRVSGWRDFGAFVDLGGADGLIHVSELAWHRVEHPREVVNMHEELDVYILKVDRERERISLSRKKLLPNPWSLVDDKYDVGQLVEGTIIRIVDYGAFVEVEPGVEGLLHTSQITGSGTVSPHDILEEGETHLLRIISINADRQRMGLSLKAVTATEQIEWMTQREQATAEAAESESAEAEGDEAPVDEAPVDEAPVDEAPVDEAEEPVAEEPVDEAPVDEDEEPVAEEPVSEIESEDAAAGEEAAQDGSNQEETVTESVESETEPAA